MARSKAKASSITVHGTTFTKRDVELIIAAIGSTKCGLNPNIELFASLGQFETPAVAQQAWDTVRRKYGAVIDALTGEEEEAEKEEVEDEAEAEEEEEEAYTVKPLPKSAARNKPLKPALKPTTPIAEEGESDRRRSKRGAAVESDHETSPARKPAKAPVKKGRTAKPAKRTVYAGADEPEAEIEHPAIVVDKRAGADAAAAMVEDDNNDEEDDEAEEVVEQAPAKKRGRPAKGKGKAKKAKNTAHVEAEEDNALSAYESALVGMKGGR
ncbi:hypothetical protein B0A48_02340 [Cryoendolithus antarcticus]|uniref:Uncharacterized protein n=1 Tax=Cryoendolithus antarcticus TaxID=1507870 RepID=A0A1V8TNE2_9PEZI|nr:hypothetical protein B0A48_02340 [Cryoendolithus antarcticus]